MAMFEYFEDIHQLIKEQSAVASLIAMEARKLTSQIYNATDGRINSDLLQALTALVVSNMDYEHIKIEYQQRERQRAVNQEIEESVQRMQANHF